MTINRFAAVCAIDFTHTCSEYARIWVFYTNSFAELALSIGEEIDRRNSAAAANGQDYYPSDVATQAAERFNEIAPTLGLLEETIPPDLVARLLD